jgi:hypothetical protein
MVVGVIVVVMGVRVVGLRVVVVVVRMVVRLRLRVRLRVRRRASPGLNHLMHDLHVMSKKCSSITRSCSTRSAHHGTDKVVGGILSRRRNSSQLFCTFLGMDISILAHYAEH